MKQRFIFLAIAICLSHSSIAGTVTTNGNIGNAKKGCTGLGICKVSTTSQEQLSMIWHIEPDGKTLLLHLNKIELAEKQAPTAELFVAKTKLLFEDEIEIPKKVITQLQLSNTIIPAGSYNLLDKKDEYIIVFTF